jgi:hypothetical protein
VYDKKTNTLEKLCRNLQDERKNHLSKIQMLEGGGGFAIKEEVRDVADNLSEGKTTL